MNRFFTFVLLLIGTAVVSSGAEVEAPVRQPENLIKALDGLREHCMVEGTEIGVFMTDAETGALVEESTRFSISCDMGNRYLQDAINSFKTDKDCGYRYDYCEPANKDTYILEVLGKRINVRKEGQTMWLLCVKNAEHAGMRDLYALVLNEESGEAKGEVYIMTSDRPDLKEANDGSSSAATVLDINTAKFDSMVKSLDTDAAGRRLKNTIVANKILLDQLNQQIKAISKNRDINTDGLLKELYQKVNTVTTNMQRAIDEYAGLIK